MNHYAIHESHSVVFAWNSTGQNTGSLSLLQGIFPTWGSYPGLLHCRAILYPLSHKGSPRVLERVAYAFSSGSSRPRNQTGVSCIVDESFTDWAIRKALCYISETNIISWISHISINFLKNYAVSPIKIVFLKYWNNETTFLPKK